MSGEKCDRCCPVPESYNGTEMFTCLRCGRSSANRDSFYNRSGDSR